MARSVQDGIAAQLRNIEASSGRSIDEWVELIGGSGLTKHNEVVAMLKREHGMTHGAAHRVSLVARERLGAEPAPAVPKTALEPVQALLLAAIRALGSDVEEAPKKGYVSLRRRKQFGMVQPGAQWINLGLILPGVETTARLESAGKWNGLFTHRVRVRAAAEVDAELCGWLRRAYEAAG